MMATEKSYAAHFLSEVQVCNECDKNTLRHLYVLPLLANVGIIASVAALCGFIGQEMYESQFPLPYWTFFASSVVFAPTMVALCKVLPDPSHSLLVGGLITTAGCLWTAFSTGHQQIFIFGIVVGTGVTLSITSTSISLAPYFVQRSKKAAVWILVAVAFITVTVHSAVNNLLAALGNRTFVILSPAACITSIVPFLTRLWFQTKRRTNQNNRFPCHGSTRGDLESNMLIPEKCCYDSVCPCIKRRLRSMTIQDGWLVSIISVIVWLFWGAGVDSTWHSMLLSPGTESSWLMLISTTSASMSESVIIIQLLLSMAVLLIKIITEPRTTLRSSSSSSSLPSFITSPCHSSAQHSEKLAFGCNYMFLGFLGVGGLLVALCPNYTTPIHTHLIFSLGFALQFDDLSDLNANDDDDDMPTSQKHARINYSIKLKSLDKLEPKKSGLDLYCLVCHLLSLFMMSCLAMLLGLQICNAIIYILSLSPLVYLFSTGGLVFISTISIVLSLVQPNSWL